MMTTIYYDSMMSDYSAGITLDFLSNTTMNEKHNILVNESIPENTPPKIQYYGVGIGGIGDTIKVAYHNAKDGALFDHIPFVIRPINLDLSVEDRVNYRMRVEKQIRGTNYVLYYLKKLPTNPDTAYIKKLTKNSNGLGTLSKFDNNDSTILNPVPTSVTDLDYNKSVFYVKELKFSITLTQAEKNEIINAYRIINNTTDIPNISEICIFTGLDKEVSATIKEAYAVRAAFFYPMASEYQSFLNDAGLYQHYINIGGMKLH